MTDIVHKNGKILKQGEFANTKDMPFYVSGSAEHAKATKIQKIKYDVGNECVFEITKGDKKWTISLDDFFDKVIQICGEKKMTNLTEYSWYYCKMKDDDIQMLERGDDYFLSGDVPLLNNEVEQVLGEVPSYEQWQAKLEENENLKKDFKLMKRLLRRMEESDNAREKFQNGRIEKFKKLLKECVEYVKKDYGDYLTYTQSAIYQEISEVLGEDK